MPRLRVVALLCAAFSCAVAARFAPSTHAAGPQFFRLEGAKDFLEGELDGLSVDALGRLRLGPAPRPLCDASAPNAWVVARDAAGTLYLGTGNDGRVMKVSSGKASLLFDADELEVHALAVGPDGRVYAGTSPDGAVYAIDAAGKVTRFFDPEEKYVWALAFDKAGNLYVATGGEGRVYRVGRDGKGTLALKTADTHVLSLALDARGRLFAGTAPQGLLYRLDAQDHVSVLLDSPYQEIRALEIGEDGALYAAGVEGRTTETAARAPAAPAAQAATGATVVPEVTVTESFSIVAPAGSAAAVSQAADAAAAAATPKGALLRVREGGEVDTIWSSTEDVPHSLVRAGHALLVGTGNKGKLYRVAGVGDWSLVATLPAEQVTALAGGGANETLVVTSNPGRVYVLEGRLAAQGSYLSKVKDAQTASRWGQLSWEGQAPQGTAVQIQTRTGNTESPDATWSDWSPAARGNAEAARFLQIRVTLSGKEGLTPTVESVAAAYLQRNLPPEVRAITLHPAGEVFQKPISVSGDPEILGLDTDTASNRAAVARTASNSPPAISFSRKMYQRGMRTVSWQADDPNDDALSYDVQYRALGDERWRPLRRGLTEPVLAWDTSTVPNGRYVVRVTASDAPGNPPAFTLTASRDSGSFQVDNAAPTVAATLEPGRPGRIRAVARDDSPVRRLEFAVDAGDWQEVPAKDGIADSQEEEFEIVLPPAAQAGSRVVVLRATDILGNVATVRVDVP